MSFDLGNNDNIVVVGEEIRESDQQQAPRGSAWARRLRDLLLAEHPQWQGQVIDQTLPGDHLHTCRQRWSDDVLWHRPAWVVLTLGLADCWHQQNQGSECMDAESFGQALQELLGFTRAHSPETRILLVDTPNLTLNDDPAWYTGQIRRLHAGYRQALGAAAALDGVDYVPVQESLESVLRSEGPLALGGDEAHPNQEGSILLAEQVHRALGGTKPAAPRLQAGETVLFIGDSITDAGHRQPGLAPYGTGYMRLWQALLHAREPQLARSLHLINSGIGGHTIRNLQFRWQEDCLAHKPDQLVMKIGINDINRFVSQSPDPISPASYEAIYDELLDRLREQQPDCRMQLLSPYYLSQESNPLSYRHRVLQALPDYLAAGERIAKKYHAGWIDLHTRFQALLQNRPGAIFGSNHGADIVHPSETGCMIIAEALYQAL